MKNTKTVTVQVLVGTGSRHETKDINGISHFLEHMVFKGTQKRPDKTAIAQELDSVGAAYNAFTGKEYTGYWVKVDNSHLELAVDVVSDMFLNSTLPAEEIEKERGVVLGEIDMYEDLPRRKVAKLFEKMLFGDQPLGRTVSGEKSVIKSLKRDDFVDYRKAHYRSRNIVIIVAGNFDLRRGKKLIKEYFSNIKGGSAPKALPVKERQSKPQIGRINKKLDQTHFILGLRSFGRLDKRIWSIGALGNILGGNMSSRLFIRIRDELGLGYYVGAGNYSRTDVGDFAVTAGVDKKRVTEAITEVMEQLEKAKQDGVTEKELKKAKSYAKGKSAMGLESSSSVADFYGFQELLDRKILTPAQELRMINKVTTQDVKKVAKDIFKNKNLNLAIIGPGVNIREIRKVLKF